ncbi:MAG: hypothetical protein TU36_007090 [Vulcanisaeta sp. AZ3]|jgi:hypothetical protein|nr:MAG: hypothetical protein TU36_01020 [Vulcanisaeta sp. AZ3]
MDELREIISKYWDLVLGVFHLGVNCCGDDCIVRMLNIEHIRNLGCKVYGLMIDKRQIDELLRYPSIIKSILDRGINKIITYPCISQDRINFMSKLGFKVINYISSNNCPLTEEVVIHLDAYRVIDLTNMGIKVYVHLYEPYIKDKPSYGIVTVLEPILEHLRRSNVKFYLILDEL